MRPKRIGTSSRMTARRATQCESRQFPTRPNGLPWVGLLAFLLLTISSAPGDTYTVQAGDTLWGIARDHEVPIDALRDANRLGESAVVITGQVLTIPDDAGRPDQAAGPDTPTAPAAGRKHEVQPGETLYSIATQYQTTVAILRGLNGMEEDEVLTSGSTLDIPANDRVTDNAPATQPGPGAVWHKVKRGDTLSSIARQYKVGLDDLEGWNNIDRESPLIAGAQLRVSDNRAEAPEQESAQSGGIESEASAASGLTYTVIRGDTLSSIARAHQVRIAHLAEVNQIPADTMVRTGQVLNLPAGAVTPIAADVTENTRPEGAPHPPETEAGKEPTAETENIATAEPVDPPTDQPGDGPAPDPEAGGTEGAGDQLAEVSPVSSERPAEDLASAFSYEIQPGQTLTEIASIFSTTEDQLLGINPKLRQAPPLRPGDRILVPGEGLKERFASQF